MKTILKSVRVSTIHQFDKQFTIYEKAEEESEITPRKHVGEGVKISIGYLCEESEKRLQSLDSELPQSPPIKKKILKQYTDNSFFTDESLKDDMRGSDKIWYENLDKVKDKIKVKVYSYKNKGSNEEWNDKMSISSVSNNAERLFEKASLHISPERVTLKPQQSLFKSKETFQDIWYNK